MSQQIKRTLEHGYTVEQLIEDLQALNPKAHVVFKCDYGDHCHTQQALPVEDVQALSPAFEKLTESAYSNSGISIEEVDDDDVEWAEAGDDEEFGLDVVVLS